jgi:hypothetical protein
MTVLTFVDCETTGLDARIHQPYEVSYWHEGDSIPIVRDLPHSLEYADQMALKIGGYFKRDKGPWTDDGVVREELAYQLRDVTLVGSNPAFDAAMLTRFIGAPVWHHRLINVAEGAMWLFGWDRPKGLADVTAHLRDLGHDIPEPDHTAEGDVCTTRAVYYALREVGK